VTTRLTIRIDFDSKRQLGHGKIRLLELIAAHGSISSAARAMKMSYRRAWLLMDEVNNMFASPVFETQLGGKGGGNARLTEFGRKLVALYRSVEKDTEQRFADEIAELEKALKPAAGPTE
jgi:molybdate transport system regulatory protein